MILLVFLFLVNGCISQVTPGTDMSKAETLEDKNFLLIGWDGVERSHLLELLDEKRLPNLQKMIDEGKFVSIDITEGNTQTKPGWSQILTGYNANFLGIPSNRIYKPIPPGFTVFERVEEYFGKENIDTIFIAGKFQNLGVRGPHWICLNCSGRSATTRKKLPWWDHDNSSDNRDEKALAYREGDPYFYAKNQIDFFQNGLGNNFNVGNKALEVLENYKEKRFFAFIHFEEPDEPGHRFGENSDEYSNGIIQNDVWLGRIVEKLKEDKIYSKTIIFVLTDHGMDEGGFYHENAPYIFLVSSYNKLRDFGDRKDITPTILDMYGFDFETIEPPLHGKSLMIK